MVHFSDASHTHRPRSRSRADRWGDAEIHTLAVALFTPGDRLWFADIPYQHYTYYRCVKSPAAMHGACLQNATRAIEWSPDATSVRRLLGGRAEVVRKEPGDFAMRPAQDHLESKAFLRLAEGAWHWPREQLQRRLR